MATTMNPYLNFDGKAEAAMRFYTECVGGKLDIMRFGDAPPQPGQPPMSADVKNRVMHATIKAPGFTLMASDTMPGQPASSGSAISLSMNFDDKNEQDRVWKKLSDGAQVTMPLGEQFFGRFGMLKDKFGVHWMLHWQAPQK